MSDHSASGAEAWVDDHCHLDHDGLGDAAVADAVTAGVTRMVTVGCDLASSRASLALAGRHPGVVFATAGVHPHDARHGLDGIAELLDEPDVVAVGECGLDYHYDHSPRDVQREVFAAQVALAVEYGLPLVIHTREAWDDTFDVLAAGLRPDRLVFHCFTGGPAEAARALDMGGHLSISGIVTFPSAGDVRDAVRLAPRDRLLVETDSPYLAPVPHRGRPNRPALAAVVGAAVAEVRGESCEEVAAATTATAVALYDLR